MLARFSTRKGVLVLAAFVFALISLLRANGASAQTQLAVEYYYADWNFYFVTSDPGEIAALDGGAFGGLWKRTGQTFNVWSGPTNGALPACRFFSVAFAPKSSHFYTPYAAECASLKAGNAWQYEGIAFYVLLPDANGNCPSGTTILYRLYNNGMGGAPNHRFTVSSATFNQMQTAGWTFEGDGRTGAYACVPATVIPGGTAEGLWAGTATGNAPVFGAVLDDGTFYLLSTTTFNTYFVQGTGTSNNGLFTSSNAIEVSFGRGFGVHSATVSALYVPQTSLGGTVTAEAGASTFDFQTTYSQLYQQPASLSAAAGSYSGVAANSASENRAVFTLAANGALSGSSAGCTFAGTATPRGTVNVFDLSLTLQGACSLGSGAVTGIVSYLNGELLVLAVNATRTDGFVAIGNKQ